MPGSTRTCGEGSGRRENGTALAQTTFPSHMDYAGLGARDLRFRCDGQLLYRVGWHSVVATNAFVLLGRT